MPYVYCTRTGWPQHRRFRRGYRLAEDRCQNCGARLTRKKPADADLMFIDSAMAVPPRCTRTEKCWEVRAVYRPTGAVREGVRGGISIESWAESIVRTQIYDAVEYRCEHCAYGFHATVNIRYEVQKDAAAAPAQVRKDQPCPPQAASSSAKSRPTT